MDLQFPIKLSAIICLLLAVESTNAQRRNEKPNVLMIAIDDLNDWIGPMGIQPGAYTPNLNELAKRGMLFTNAHCQAPLCGPSRASLLTGLRPSTTGIYGMIKDDSIKNANDATRRSVFLPEYFKRYGYKTMGVGKIFHESAPQGVFEIFGGRSPGFGPNAPKRFHWNRPKTGTDWGAFPERDEDMPDYQSAHWAIDRLQERHDRPFFLAVGFLRPHVPWYVPQKWFDLIAGKGIKTPPYLENDMDDIPDIGKRLTEMDMMPTTEWAIQNSQWQQMCEAYVACVAFVDHYVGEVIKALDDSPYKDNTIIVLWSDHGYHLGEKNRFAKSSLWDRSTRTPLLIVSPSAKTNGQQCSQPAELLDIYPTLLDLCGLPKNRQLDGSSLAKLIHNPTTRWTHPAICTYARNNHSVRFGNFRYIRYEDGSEELYDHRSDPNEWENVANRSEYRRQKERMKKYLPNVNAFWANGSAYNYNEYLTKQKQNQ